MQSLGEAFGSGFKAGDQLGANLDSRKSDQMRLALQKDQLAEQMKDREMRTAIMQQRANTYDARAAGSGGGPTDDSAYLADLPDGVDVDTMPTSGGRGGGYKSPGSRGGGSSGDPLIEALQTARLIQAGAAAGKQVQTVAGQIGDIDVKLGQLPSDHPDRPALMAQRDILNTQYGKAQAFDTAVQLTGSSRLLPQLPKDKQGNLRPDLMTDAQKATASHLGLTLPAPETDTDDAAGPADPFAAAPSAPGPIKVPAMTPDEMRPFLDGSHPVSIGSPAGSPVPGASGPATGADAFAGPTPPPDAPTPAGSPSAAPGAAPASTFQPVSRKPAGGGPPDGTTATNPKTGQKLVRFMGNWVPADSK